MFYKIINSKMIQSATVKAIIFFAFITLCSSVTSFAQSVTAELVMPENCEIPINSNTEYSGFGWTDHFTIIAANPATNRIYMGLSCYDQGPRLVAINGNDNSQQIIDLQISGYDQYEVRGIAVDSQRNRIYLPVTHSLGGAHDSLLVYDANTNTKQIFPMPPPPDGGPISSQGQLVVNSITNRVYTYGGGKVLVFNANDNSFSSFIVPGSEEGFRGIAIDETRNWLYLYSGFGSSIKVLDLSTIQIIASVSTCTNIEQTDCFEGSGSMAVNPVTNRIYLIGGFDPSDSDGWNPPFPTIMVLNGDNFSYEMVNIPQPDIPEYSWFGWNADNAEIVVNPKTNRVYTSNLFSYGSEFQLVTLDGNTNAVNLKAIGQDTVFYEWGTPAINPETNLIYIANRFRSIRVVAPASSGTISVEQPVVQADAATLNFSEANLSGEGKVSVTPISDPSVAGEIPGGFAISDLLAYEITPDASLQFNGPVTTCFSVPSVNDETEFNSLAVLHRELNQATGEYELFDRTSSRNFSTRSICATTTSFSPFYLARKGNKIKSLFEKSKAYKSGSTIPVKLQLLNSDNVNISSSALTLTARGLRLIDSNTTSDVVDSGNANPDNNFRYDSALRGYIYNLSTKGLVRGKYVLSFYEGSNRSFFYTVTFEVK